MKEGRGGEESQGIAVRRKKQLIQQIKTQNKSCVDTINLPVVLFMFQTYPRVIQGLLKDEEKSVGYSFHNISWEQLV